MNHFCLAAALLGTNVCENDTAITVGEQSFMSHMAEQGLSYGTAAEYEFRFAQFMKIDAELAEINANPENTYTVVHNQFSTWTSDEYNRLLGSKQDENVDVEVLDLPTDNLLETVDWTSHMMPVQNQGQCGSCWAFSATGTIEGHHHMKTGQHVKLSEQQMVDCYYTRDGCEGGDHTGAQSWVGQYGQALASAYPYTAKYAGHCVKKGGSIKTTHVYRVQTGSVASLKAAINKGPVAISLNASSTSFRNLGTGILNDTSCSQSPNHAIIAVGYGSNYYVVRNSWGTSWGNKGYGKVAQVNGKGICGIQTHLDWSDTN
jgi:C1A family cysteine protease